MITLSFWSSLEFFEGLCFISLMFSEQFFGRQWCDCSLYFSLNNGGGSSSLIWFFFHHVLFWCFPLWSTSTAYIPYLQFVYTASVVYIHIWIYLNIWHKYNILVWSEYCNLLLRINKALIAQTDKKPINHISKFFKSM